MSDISNTNGSSRQKPILIVLAGRTHPEISRTLGDYEHWIAAGLGDGLPYSAVDARACPAYPEPSALAGVVVSGSHAMVTDREVWSERLAGWLRSCVAAELPVLGICYGHQLLAHALGGVVANHPKGPEVGTRTLSLADAAQDDLLFTGLPGTFPAQWVHYQSAVVLPPEAVVLAYNDFEPHQAFRLGKRAWGLQFHPEFSAQAMRGYIRQLHDRLDDHAALLAGVRDTPDAAGLLRRFAALSHSVSVSASPVPSAR